ncbi:MAG: UTP--glucose-1-phosphate uridylyltransferase [Candidatus Omnitrophica bacterium]|nr:UTP--glucose-1-phosphate uridylyltransferase [Candidatus Omnitrophota bacterium]
MDKSSFDSMAIFTSMPWVILFILDHLAWNIANGTGISSYIGALFIGFFKGVIVGYVLCGVGVGLAMVIGRPLNFLQSVYFEKNLINEFLTKREDEKKRKYYSSPLVRTQLLNQLADLRVRFKETPEERYGVTMYNEEYHTYPVREWIQTIEYFNLSRDIAEVKYKLNLGGLTNEEIEETLGEKDVSHSLNKLLSLVTIADTVKDGISADVIILLGNDNPPTFRKAIELYNIDLKYFIIAGRQGRLTLPLIKNALNFGYTIHISDHEGLITVPDVDYREMEFMKLEDEEAINRVTRSEADIIKEILKEMARPWIDDEVTSKSAIKFLKDEDRTLIVEAENTLENFQEARNQLISRGAIKEGAILKVYVLHTPLQLLRTKGAFNTVFKKELEEGTVKGISATGEFLEKSVSETGLSNTLIIEMWRIIMYSAIGDLIPEYNGVKGLESIPEDYWQSTLELMEAYPHERELREELREMAENVKVEGNHVLRDKEDLVQKLSVLLKSIPDEMNEVIDWVYGEKENLDGIEQRIQKLNQEKEKNLDGGASDDINKAQLPLLWEGSISWVGEFETRDVPCAVCGTSDYNGIGRVVINGKEMNIVKCLEDGFMWLNPQPVGEFYKELHKKDYFIKGGSNKEQVGIIEYGLKEVEVDRRRVARIRADELKEVLGMRGRVLEIGTASGYLLKELKERGWYVEGVDISEDIVAVARKRNLEGNIHVGELRTMSYSVNSFDAVLLYDTLEHIPYPQKFMKEVKRIVKPEGIVIIRYPETPDTGPVLHLGDHISHFSEKSISLLLDKLGFSLVSIQPSGKFYGTEGKLIQNMTVIAKNGIANNCDGGISDEKIITHRIERKEQLIESITRGIKKMEMDVQLTRYGHLVAVWDKTVKGEFVYEYNTLLDLEAALERKIITLEEAFEIGRNAGIDFYLDLKDWPISEGLEEYQEYEGKLLNEIVKLVKIYNMHKRISAGSFNTGFLEKLKGQIPGLKIYLPAHEDLRDIQKTISEASKIGAYGVFIPASKLSFELINRIHKENIEVMTKYEGLNKKYVPEVDLIFKDLDGGKEITDSLNILRLQKNIELPLELGTLNVYEEANKYKITISSKTERGPPEVKTENDVIIITIYTEDLNIKNIAILIYEEILKSTGLNRLNQSDDDSEKIVNFALQSRYELEAELWSEGLIPAEAEYFKALYKQYRNPVDNNLVIKENFYPSAFLTEEQRIDLLGAVEYKDIKGNQDFIKVAKRVTLILNPLNGGIGKKVDRADDLADKWVELGREGKVVLGAKSSDLFMKVDGELVSIAEAKQLRIIKGMEEGKYNKVVLEELASLDTIQSIETLFNTVQFEDRVSGTTESKTYNEVFGSLTELELKEPFTENTMPTINKESGLFMDKPLPGGHGLTGYLLLSRSLETEFPEDEIIISAVYNEDGINNLPDETLVGYMAAQRIPIIMVTTTKTGIDEKGGQIGVAKLDKDKILSKNNVRKDILEVKQSEKVGQKDLFLKVGLTEGEKDAQYFNTNMVLINYSELIPLLQELLTTGAITREELNDIMAPSLIEEETKDKKNTGLGGAIGSVMLNLAGFLETTKDEKIKAVLNRRGLSSILNILNADIENRTNFFTPVKTAFDFYIQFYSDYYELDTEAWKLKAHRPLPPAVSLPDFYNNVTNTFKAFKGASFIDLDSLTIKGKVYLPGAILKGNVDIISESNEIVDLTKVRELTQNDELVLENIKVTIDEDGKVSIDAQDGGRLIDKIIVAGVILGIGYIYITFDKDISFVLNHPILSVLAIYLILSGLYKYYYWYERKINRLEIGFWEKINILSGNTGDRDYIPTNMHECLSDLYSRYGEKRIKNISISRVYDGRVDNAGESYGFYDEYVSCLIRREPSEKEQQMIQDIENKIHECKCVAVSIYKDWKEKTKKEEGEQVEEQQDGGKREVVGNYLKSILKEKADTLKSKQLAESFVIIKDRGEDLLVKVSEIEEYYNTMEDKSIEEIIENYCGWNVITLSKELEKVFVTKEQYKELDSEFFAGIEAAINKFKTVDITSKILEKKVEGFIVSVADIREKIKFLNLMSQNSMDKIKEDITNVKEVYSLFINNSKDSLLGFIFAGKMDNILIDLRKNMSEIDKSIKNWENISLIDKVIFVQWYLMGMYKRDFSSSSDEIESLKGGGIA